MRSLIPDTVLTDEVRQLVKIQSMTSWINIRWTDGKRLSSGQRESHGNNKIKYISLCLFKGYRLVAHPNAMLESCWILWPLIMRTSMERKPIDTLLPERKESALCIAEPSQLSYQPISCGTLRMINCRNCSVDLRLHHRL